MKTGRRRKKEPTPQEVTPPQPKGVTPPQTTRPRTKEVQPTAARRPSGTPSRRPQPWMLIVGAMIVFICVALLLSRACMGPREPATTYVPATAQGSWTTTVNLLAPGVTITERYRAECEADPQCRVIPGTCQLRERGDTYTEQTVDEYDDYAYSIYYEETEGQIYEAVAQDFVVTQLNAPKDWVEGDRHYFSQEWLDKDTCQYTNYTVWIDDPQDASYEIEVVLSECEVWDHVVVKERIYEEGEYCRTENLDTLAIQDTLTDRGTGTAIAWPAAIAPAGGDLEQAFEGTVVFRAEGVRRTVEVTDVDTYLRYLTTPYYLGLDDDGNVVDLTDQAP